MKKINVIESGKAMRTWKLVYYHQHLECLFNLTVQGYRSIITSDADCIIGGHRNYFFFFKKKEKMK